MRLIDLNALLLELKKMESEYYASEFEEDNIMGLGVMMAIKKVKDAPTVESEPVGHGSWEVRTALTYIPVEFDNDGKLIEHPYNYYVCRSCGRHVNRLENYCPSCGAKMDKKSPENHKKYQEEETNKKAFK